MSDPIGRNQFDPWMSQPSVGRMVHPNRLDFDSSKKNPEDIGLVRTSDGRFALKSESLNFPMRARQVGNQLVWETTYEDIKRGEMNGRHVRKIIENAELYGQSVHLNTGTHGGPGGITAFHSKGQDPRDIADSSFLEEDLRAIQGKSNVSLHVISSYADSIYPLEANQVIICHCCSCKVELTHNFAKANFPRAGEAVKSDPGPLAWSFVEDSDEMGRSQGENEDSLDEVTQVFGRVSLTGYVKSDPGPLGFIMTSRRI